MNAIKNGFIRLMPLTLVGAIFVLINNVLLSFGEGSFFWSMGIRLDVNTLASLEQLKVIGGSVYNGTLGIMSLMTPFFIGMALAEERKVDALAAGLLSLASFMTVTPFTIGDVSAIGANWLGGQILFLVLLLVWSLLRYSLLLSVRIGLSDYLTAYRNRFRAHLLH
ncbi:PTS system N,N'-diacetylchitobiose-specific transporter subunit IIC [Salmonella enterica subsp. arizonae]|nr:PTS system N,N'-diacetylchitobiose-specific transporter subunit IIC [Salmonella enterica subsp. arizonae]